jgi:hypothetical protein
LSSAILDFTCGADGCSAGLGWSSSHAGLGSNLGVDFTRYVSDSTPQFGTLVINPLPRSFTNPIGFTGMVHPILPAEDERDGNEIAPSEHWLSLKKAYDHKKTNPSCHNQEFGRCLRTKKVFHAVVNFTRPGRVAQLTTSICRVEESQRCEIAF